MKSPNKLRLGPLPKNESLKVTFACPIDLKEKLEQYAALHSQIYGENVDATALIPHMLNAFIGKDRIFKRVNASSAASAISEKLQDND